MSDDVEKIDVRKALDDYANALSGKPPQPTVRQVFNHCVNTVIISIVQLSVISLGCMLLWNHCLIGSVDGVHPVGYLRMFGIVMLLRAFQRFGK